jgi:hypothetical protein
MFRVSKRVSEDFVYGYLLISGLHRWKDIDMVKRRDDLIGVCYNFMDLSTGILRSLGLQTRDVMGIFPNDVGHAWNEVLFDENGNQDSWMHFDATPTLDTVGCKQCYANPQVRKRGDPDIVFADTVPLSNASPSKWFHDSEVEGVKACNPNRQDDYNCFVCWVSWFPEWFTEHCAVDVKTEYEYTGPYPSAFTEFATMVGDVSINLSMDAPLSVEKDSVFQLISVIQNVGDSSKYDIVLGVGLRPWAADSLDTYSTSSAEVLIDSLPAGSTDSVIWSVTPLRIGDAVPLSVYAYDSIQTFWVSSHMLQNINEPGTLPDLVMTGSVLPSHVEPGQMVDLFAIVLNDSLQEDTGATVTSYITSEKNPGFDDTVTLAYSEPDSAYAGYLSLPSSAPVGDYRCRFIAEETGFDSDSVITYFSVAAILSVNAVTDSSVYDCRDTVSISATLLDRADTVSDAIVQIDIHTSFGNRLLPMEFDSVSGYWASFVPTDFVPYMTDSATLPAGNWNIVVSTEHYDNYSTDSIDITVNAPDLSVTPLDISFSPSSPEEGNMVLIDAMIRNVGNAESDSTLMSFFIDQMDTSGQVGADYLIPPLVVGDSVTISVMWNTTDQAGDHVIYVQIDPHTLSVDSEWSNNVASTFITVVPGYICADVDGSGGIPNVADVDYLVNYLFFSGPPPPVMEAANVDGEGGVNVVDVDYLIQYLFFSGPEPICGPLG